MADESRHFTDIKDIRPGIKNLHCLFIVLEVGKASKTKDGNVVRACRVADKTGSITVSVWDDVGEILQPGDIIKFVRGYATLWKGSLTLYTGRGGHMEKVGDFCMVFCEVPNMSDPNAEFLQQYKQQGEQGRNSPNSSPATASSTSLPRNQNHNTEHLALPLNNSTAVSNTNTHRFHPYVRPEFSGTQGNISAKVDASRDPRLRIRGNNGGNANGNNNVFYAVGSTNGNNGLNGSDVSLRNVINSSRDPRTRR